MSRVAEATRPAARAVPSARAFRLREWLEREAVFSWLMLAPPLLFLLLFLGYPFCYGVYLSFVRRPVAQPATFVGLNNFLNLYNDAIFWQAVWNTFRLKGMTRALLLLPFIVPTVLSTVAWQWIFDPGMGLFNRLLMFLDLVKQGPSWLGNPTLAMVSVILVNTWRGLPFFGITILAGLQTIPDELMESATIDGAGWWGRFRYVTLPLLMPVIFIVTTFSIIFTFFDFQLVYVLTGGGPANATHLMATYAYSVGMSSGQMGMGSAAALAMVPVLGVVLLMMSSYVRRA